MKNRIWIVLLVVSLGINIGFLLHWSCPKSMQGKTAAADCQAPGWHDSSLRTNLGLSAKQARLMEAERRQVLALAKPLQDELRLKRRELFVFLKSKDFREPDLDMIINEISRLQVAIEKVFILHSLKARSLFSPSQLQKYEKCLERGLCPDRMGESSCPPGKTGGLGAERPGCSQADETKK